MNESVTVTEAQSVPIALKPRWLRLTPDRLILAILAVEALLWLSDRLGWPAWHKGYAVLTAVASAGTVLLVMLGWLIGSLVFCWRFQFGLRSLLVLVIAVAVPCSWMAVELKKAKRQFQAYKHIEWDLYTTNGIGEFPWYSAWLHRMLGTEGYYDPEFLVFNNFASINDETLAMLARLTNLGQLWLNGDIAITDAGLDHLKRLHQLRDLSLADAPVSAEAVQRLRRALPACEIRWEPPTKQQRHSPAAPDRPRG